MCTSKPKTLPDNSAELARRQEEERQKRINEGVLAIDNAFSGYNDDFYNQYQNDYMGYYTPQLSKQYDDARKRLTLQLAKTGNLSSSFGGNKLSELNDYYNDQNTLLSNNSLNAANDLRSNISNRKSQLYNDNRLAADPGQASRTAIEFANTLQPTPPQSPLANVFADFFNNIGNAASVNNVNQKNNTGVRTYYNNSNSVQNY